MNKEVFRKNAGIIIGNGLALAGIIGWGYFIWCLCGSGLSFGEKCLTELISYAMIIGFCWYCSLPGVGCVPVKIMFDARDYRDKEEK